MAETVQTSGDPKRTNLGKIVPTPVSKKDVHAILDIVAVDGRAYISKKSENKAAVTDSASWLKMTENNYDMAVRLGLFSGTEAEWIASLSAASEEAAKLSKEQTEKCATATSSANTAATSAANQAAYAKTQGDWAKEQGNAASDVMQLAVVLAGTLEGLIQSGETAVASINSALSELMGAACMVPYRMEVEYPKTITLGNPEAQRIRVNLLPTYYPQNFIFQRPIDGGSAVDVDPAGNIRVLEVGSATLYVVAPGNTELYERITIEVQLPAPLMAGTVMFLDHDNTIFLT